MMSMWECEVCGTMNPESFTVCKVCKALRGENMDQSDEDDFFFDEEQGFV